MQNMCVDAVYLLISHMKSDDIFTCSNMGKNDVFDVVFFLVCVVLQQKLYKKINVTERNLLIYKTCVCKCYISLCNV